MKKAILFSLFVIGYFLFSPEISNAASSLSEVKTTQDLHQELKDAKLVHLDENGLIAVPDNLSSLGVNQDLSEEYIKMVNKTNEQIQDGIISMDKELNVEPFTIEEIAEKVYANDKKDEEENNLSTTGVTAMATASEYLDVVNLVETNRGELEDIYYTQATFDPGSAYNFAVGWWVGKVQEGGDWDYKVVEGYSPWYKTFNMALYNGIVQEHHSKWLGNYNYGYTGEFLFSLSILLAGGDAISYALNWEPDTPEVKQTIEHGFSDAYWFY